ncbi:phospholipase DDHD1 isoform X1 [Clarias gariepinus]|uniref:phospholipase DDHD1 isoform X1 n=1 Tax=Clarias gariepinus TaxID=13013 RepID=UPI00234E0CAB|nr:phospholipase DDHD1 isoform X1 [Clarias gariepinus]
MSSFTNKTPFISPPESPKNGRTAWALGDDRFPCSYDDSLAVQADVERHLGLLHNRQDAMALCLDQSYRSGTESYLSGSQLDYNENNGSTSPVESRRKHRSGVHRPRFEVVDLGEEEVRWFYKEDKKTWKPFVGHDSLRIELMYRKLCELNPERESGSGHAVPPGGEEDACEHASAVASEQSPPQLEDTDLEVSVDAVCVRGGLYEVDVRERECYPVYWNRSCLDAFCPTEQDRIPVLRGQWFIDGTWTPMEEDESDLIEKEHLMCFRGQQMQDSLENDVVAKTTDSKDVIHSLKLSRSHVDWHSVDEVYLYSDATTSKIARTVTQKLGFSKASSSGTRLHRGYVEEASLEDKPPQTTHIVFVVHGIGQKMDKDRIIKNTGMLRETVRKMEEKHFAEHTEEHVEFLPVEWRSKLTLDGDTVDSITPDKVRGLRDLLNSSAMDIMYYTSPLYRDEITKGLTQELNRLYSLFCSRNPEFEQKGGKVSIISHSLGCVITYDIMTGWDPVRSRLQEPNEEELHWMSCKEQHLLDQIQLARQRLQELEDQLQGLEATKLPAAPELRFKVENYFCMGSPLAVFLALRGIRPGNTGYQDHIMPKSICQRLFNIFHPTDPVAYRLEPLVLKHYNNIAPVQIHWCNTYNPTPYDEVKPTFLTPVKDPASDTESLPSPTTSPVMSRRLYGESITTLGKASILGAASIGKGIGGMLFSRFSRSSSQPLGVDSVAVEGEEKSQSAYGLSTMSQSTSTITETAVEMEHRIDFELREGLVESRYWSAVTSHTAYWNSHDVALFLLTFIYKSQSSSEIYQDDPDPV